MKSPLCLVLVGLMLPSLAPAQAPADPNYERAKALFEAGSRAYKLGNYSLACVAMGESYLLSPRPALAFSLAQANRMQFLADGDPQKLERAVSLYAAYLEQDPSGNRRAHAQQLLTVLRPVLVRVQRERPEAFTKGGLDQSARLLLSTTAEGARATIDEQEIDELPEIITVEAGKHDVVISAPGYHEKRITSIAVSGQLVPVSMDLEPLPARVQVHTGDDAEVYVDGLTRGNTPLLGPLELSAGAHVLVVAARGKVAHRSDLDLVRGQELTVDVSLVMTLQRKWAWGLAATSIAFVGAGLGTTFAALAKQSQAQDLEAQLAQQSLTLDQVELHRQLEADRDTFTRVSAGLFGAAIASGLASGLLFVLDTPDIPSVSTNLLVAPSAPGAGAGATVRLRY